jgi:hypothetical protein
VRWKKLFSFLCIMISLSLRADIMMCDFCTIPALSFYSLLSAMLTHNLSVINNIKNELAFWITVYTAALTSDWIILMIFSSLFSLLLLLWNASFTQYFSALMRFSAALIKTVAVLKAFSVLYIVIKLKKFVFSVFNYLFLCFNVVSLFFWYSAFALTPYSEL